MQKAIIIATISIVMVIALTALHLLTSNTYAQVSGKTVVLYDNAEGHARGWDPDGLNSNQWIFDQEFNPYKSTVLINLKLPERQYHPPFLISHCDAFPTPSNIAGIFHISCGGGNALTPLDGSELHYTLFNPICQRPIDCFDIEVPPVVIGDILNSSRNNLTQGTEDALSLEQQEMLANVTDAGSR